MKSNPIVSYVENWIAELSDQVEQEREANTHLQEELDSIFKELKRSEIENTKLKERNAYLRDSLTKMYLQSEVKDGL